MYGLLVLGAVGVAAIVYGSLTVKLLSTLAVVSTWYLSRRPPGIPPGPRGVPLLGYIPFLGTRVHRTFNELGKRYGPVCSVFIGSRVTVVLNDYVTIRKCLVEQGEVFSNRPDNTFGSTNPTDHKSVGLSNGQFWKEHRRFALETLRDYGVGKASIEPAIQDELQYFLEVLEATRGESFDINKSLAMSVSNNICIMAYGHRFEYSDSEFLELTSLVKVFMENVASTGVHVAFPWLRYIPGSDKIGGFDKLKGYALRLVDHAVKMMKEHKDVYRPGSRDDYINSYFTEMEERKRTGQFPEFFDEETLESNLRTLFMAGTDTTANTLLWGVLYMMIHPDIQAKVQKEIDHVVGRDRLPTCADRSNLPYTEATLIEIQRRATIAPLGGPHCNSQDVELYGYRIPKGTMIMPNIWAVHHDEKLFPDPMTFRPERYINEKGQVSKPDYVIPFSIGKRFCLGEPLARMELYLYFTAMLQRFSFKTPPGEALCVQEVPSGNSPYPFRLQAIPRD